VWSAQPVYFALHCAGVVRAARQFLVNAQFDPNAAPGRRRDRPPPRARGDGARAALDRRDEAAGRHSRLLGASRLQRGPRAGAEGRDVAGLAGACCRAATGGSSCRAWPAEQARTADALYRKVRAGTPAIIRVFRFPVMTINHAVLLYDAAERDGDLEFTAYDPNDVAGRSSSASTARPARSSFRRATTSTAAHQGLRDLCRHAVVAHAARVAALAVAVTASGCVTGHVLQAGRRREYAREIHAVTQDGGETIVAYTADVVDDDGVPCGDRRAYHPPPRRAGPRRAFATLTRTRTAPWAYALVPAALAAGRGRDADADPHVARGSRGGGLM
jgi:hypothetical protein